MFNSSFEAKPGRLGESCTSPKYATGLLRLREPDFPNGDGDDKQSYKR